MSRVESRTLKREGHDLVWEATWDGCRVEVALGPSDGDDAACRVETLEFASPRTAREDYDEEQAWEDYGREEADSQVCLHDAGRDPSQVPPTGDADTEPETGTSGVDQRWDAFKDDVFDIDHA